MVDTELLEAIRGVVRDEIKPVNERLDRMDRRFEQIDKRLDGMDKRFEQVDKRFEQVDKRFEQVDKRFEAIDDRFEQIDRRFELVDQRFDEQHAYLDRRFAEQENRLMAHMDAIKEFLEGRIRTIGENHLTLNSKLDGLRTELKQVAEESERRDMELSRRFLEHEQTHVSIRKDITRLQSQVSDVSERLYVVEKKVFKEPKSKK